MYEKIKKKTNGKIKRIEKIKKNDPKNQTVLLHFLNILFKQPRVIANFFKNWLEIVSTFGFSVVNLKFKKSIPKSRKT